MLWENDKLYEVEEEKVIGCCDSNEEIFRFSTFLCQLCCRILTCIIPQIRFIASRWLMMAVDA